MNEQQTYQEEKIELTPFDNNRLLNLCGRFDEHLKLIEKSLNIEISNKGNIFKITGEKKQIVLAKKILYKLYRQTEHNSDLSPRQIHLYLQQYKNINNTSGKKAADTNIRTPNIIVTARSKNQTEYLKQINQNPVNFGIGPAGTGKTFLAVACAVSALEQHKVKRIILVRPVVEAGEKLGFLPGDLTQKIDPYLRPLYDSLYEMLGFEKVSKYLERQIIEIAPLAYMRGRTLNDSFIILDESQNTTVDQMKMFLTRLGYSSTAVITGDITQVDLPRGKMSGLKHAIKILDNIPDISITRFIPSDIIRHPIVQSIISAYDKHENNKGNEE